MSTVHGDTAITCPFNVLDRTGRGLRVYMHVFTEVLFFVGLVVVELFFLFRFFSQEFVNDGG